MTVLKRKKAANKPGKPGERSTPRVFELLPLKLMALELMALEFCDGLAQGMNQADAARFARYKKPAHDGIRLMTSTECLRKENEGRGRWPFLPSTPEQLRECPANALLMPWKMAKTRHFKKLPRTPLLIPL